MAKVPRLQKKDCLMAKVPCLPRRNQCKNEHQRALLGSWGQLGGLYWASWGRLKCHAACLEAYLGALWDHVASHGTDLETMLDLLGPTWDHAGLLGPDLGTMWKRFEGYEASWERVFTKLYYLHVFGNRKEAFCTLLAVSGHKTAISVL